MTIFNTVSTTATIKNTNHCVGFDLHINIPAGRKAGKYLQKVAGKGHNMDIKSLVESLNYSITVARTGEDFTDLLNDCHSCQSNDMKAQKLYRDVWSSVEGVVVIGLMDDTSFEYMARCIVNPKWGTHAPVYGPKHYLLEARLKYAGYSKGAVAPLEDVQQAVDRFAGTVEEGLKDAPKSRKEEIIAVWYPRNEYVKRAEEILEQLYNKISAIHIACPNSMPQDERLKKFEKLGLHRKWDAVRLATKQLNKFKTKQAKYEIACRKHNRKVGEKFNTTHIRHVPIREDGWEYQKKNILKSVQTSLYVDHTREFLWTRYERTIGWYKK